MDVDEGARLPYYTPPHSSYAAATQSSAAGAQGSGSSKSGKGKGKQRAQDESRSTRHEDKRDWELAAVMDRMSRAGIDPSLVDFLDVGMAQVVLSQLLDEVDSLRESVSRSNNARAQISAQLQQARKRPASPLDSGRQGGPARVIPSQPTAGPSRNRRDEVESRMTQPTTVETAESSAAQSMDASQSTQPMDTTDGSEVTHIISEEVRASRARHAAAHARRQERAAGGLLPGLVVRPPPRPTTPEPEVSGRTTKKGTTVVHAGLSRPELEPNAFTPSASGAFHEPRPVSQSADEAVPYTPRGFSDPTTYTIPQHLNGAPQHSGSTTREDRMIAPRGVEPIPDLGEYTKKYIADRLALMKAQAKVPVNWNPDPSSSSDDGGSGPEVELTDDEVEETPQERDERKAKNLQITTKQLKKMRNDANTERAGRIADAGPLVEGLATVIMNGRRERSNNFATLLDFHTYYSARSNTIYTGRSALEASRFEANRAEPYVSRLSLYREVPRGFPMIPRQIPQLRTIISNPTADPRSRFEAWMVLGEFHRVATRLYPPLRDRTMNTVITMIPHAWLQQPPISQNDPAWQVAMLPLDPAAFTGRPTNRTRGAGLPPLTEESALDINRWAQYIAHHGRPGSDNTFAGIPIDWALRVYLPAMFGYCLGRILAPNTPSARTAFMRQWAMIAAQPGLYDEAIMARNIRFPLTPFEEVLPQDTEISVRRFVYDEANASHISEADVLETLILNHIPRAWVDHSYAFGFNYLEHYFGGPSLHHQLYLNTDRSRILRLNIRGDFPPTIPRWDGWWTPTRSDHQRIHVLTQIGLTVHDRRPDDGLEWFFVGSPPIFRWLVTRSVEEAGVVFPPPSNDDDAPSGPLITVPFVDDQATIGDELNTLSLTTQHTVYPTRVAAAVPPPPPAALQVEDMDVAPDPGVTSTAATTAVTPSLAVHETAPTNALPPTAPQVVEPPSPTQLPSEPIEAAMDTRTDG